MPVQDPAHNNWQKAETEITTGTVAKDFKFLWKLKLGKGSGKIIVVQRAPSLSRPDHRPRI